jgi:hypothetical protein
MQNDYSGPERRKFIRLDYVTPLAFKVCKGDIIDKLLQGYTSNISQTGLMCTINEKVKEDDILWLSFDRDTISVCEEIERNCLVYQSGIIGKVARVEEKGDNVYKIGIQFITREERNLTNIYPKIYFLEKHKGTTPP